MLFACLSLPRSPALPGLCTRCHSSVLNALHSLHSPPTPPFRVSHARPRTYPHTGISRPSTARKFIAHIPFHSSFLNPACAYPRASSMFVRCPARRLPLFFLSPCGAMVETRSAGSFARSSLPAPAGRRHSAHRASRRTPSTALANRTSAAACRPAIKSFKNLHGMLFCY